MGCGPSFKSKGTSTPQKIAKKNCSEFLKNGIKMENLDLQTATSISSGGFGDVLQIQLKLDKSESLAVKVMNVNAEDERAIKEMNNEIAMIDRITEERVRPRCFPRYYGYFIETNKANNMVYNICFNYLPQTLFSLTKEHSAKKTELPIDVLIKFFNTLVNGLCFLQLLGICHRDLKPQNIMVNESKKNLTIIDFGGAKNVMAMNFPPSQTKMNVTILGTRHYASPEMLEALNRSTEDTTQNESFTTLINPFKSDAFSFGIVFMELWKFKRINNKAKQAQIDEQLEILKSDIEKYQVNQAIKKKLNIMQNILHKCLRIDPKDRWDFREIFRQNIDLIDKRKIRYHMKVDELSDIKEIEDFLRRSMTASEFFGYNSEDYKEAKDNYESFFRNNIKFDQLQYGQRIYQGENSSIIKATIKKRQEEYVGKMMVLRIGQNDEQIKREIKFNEKLTRKLEAPKCFVEYYGHATETSLLKQVTYHLLFKYYPCNLRDVIKKKILVNNFELIKSYFYQIVRGLAFLEACGIAHRDLKPENIMVDAKYERIFIGDLGSAVNVSTLANSQHRFVGTEEYRSPEWFDCDLKGVSEGQIDCIKSDCFVLGLMILEMGGSPLNLVKCDSHDDYKKGLSQMIENFRKMYDAEIIKTKQNEVFFKEIISLLSEKPGDRPSFLDVYLKTLNTEEELKLKYHIFVQDHDIMEIRMKPPRKEPKKEKTEIQVIAPNIVQITSDDLNKLMENKLSENSPEKILEDVYLCLDKYLNGVTPSGFKDAVLKHMNLIEELVHKGHSRALLLKGVCHEEGFLEDSREKAKECYIKSWAGEPKDPLALYELATCLYMDGKYKEAVEKSDLAASKGNKLAMSWLGARYLNGGNGVIKNNEKALEFLRKGAEAGSAWGMLNLAGILNEGEICPQNIEEAKGWYRKAAKIGNNKAIDQLWTKFGERLEN